jgi:hypothetical protein
MDLKNDSWVVGVAILGCVCDELRDWEPLLIEFEAALTDDAPDVEVAV